MKPKSISALFLGSLILITASYLIYYEINLTDTVVAKNLENGTITDAQEKSIDTILNLSHIMIGWAVAIIGATAFFLKLNVEQNLALSKIDLTISLVIFLLSVASIYFGHLGIDKVAEMLSLNQFPIGVSLIRELFSRQYLMCLVAISLFGIHVIQFFWRRIQV